MGIPIDVARLKEEFSRYNDPEAEIEIADTSRGFIVTITVPISIYNREEAEEREEVLLKRGEIKPGWLLNIETVKKRQRYDVTDSHLWQEPAEWTKDCFSNRYEDMGLYSRLIYMALKRGDYREAVKCVFEDARSFNIFDTTLCYDLIRWREKYSL